MKIYTLSEDGEPLRCLNLMEWALWYEYGERGVKQDIVGDFWVSTVFLGLDYGWGNEAPILWETMVFKDGKDVELDRCAGNREQALAMHEAMVERMQAVVALET